MPSHSIAVLAPAVLALGLSIPSAQACLLHQATFGLLFQPAYPGSLEVAAAAGQAEKDKLLPAAPNRDGEVTLKAISSEMEKLGRRLDRVPETHKVEFFVMLAGQQLWTHYRVIRDPLGAAYSVNAHTNRPFHKVPIVITSYPVIVALHDGALTLDNALDARLIDIRSDDGNTVAALLREALLVEQAAR